MTIMLELRNPHSILAALRVRPKAVKSVRVQTMQSGDVWEEVCGMAQARGVSVQVGAANTDRRNSPDKRGRHAGRETERVGGGSAMVEPPSPVPLEQLWQANSTGQSFGTWLALDQIQDPQNAGAIFRLAGFFGVRGIVMTKDRSVPVNATVCDVATGGVEHVPFSIVANLAQAIEKAQQNAVWVLGTCERAEQSIYQIQRDRNWMLVMGNEGSGIRRLTRDRCDQLVALPPTGAVPSLNVAAATSACLALLNRPPA